MNSAESTLTGSARAADASPVPAHATHAGASHGSGKSYATGFVLSLMLTAIPFAMVMSGALPRSTVLPSILAIGVLQIVVHLVCFLHMNTKSEGGWNALAFAFTVVITVILVAGSVWIMQHLDHNLAMAMPN
jgi:cytochrome o ubiquinol oxidase subunit IV